MLLNKYESVKHYHVKGKYANVRHKKHLTII